jgi:hypothetical protein
MKLPVGRAVRSWGTGVQFGISPAWRGSTLAAAVQALQLVVADGTLSPLGSPHDSCLSVVCETSL